MFGHQISFTLAGLVILVALATAPVRAQLGGGWVATSFTKRIHLDDEAGLQTFSWTSYKSVCSNTICADYSYVSTDDTETFRIFDSRSNRSEIRLQNEYATGRRQFEGYVTFDSPLEDESLMQIFGSTTGATLTMTRGYSSGGGSITVTSTGGGVTYGSRTIVTACYGVELRINVIHDQDNYVRWYVNGVLKCEQQDTEVGVTNYWKYGCYGTTSGNVPAVVKWRAVRTFKDGYPPGSEVVAVPNAVTVAQGGSATSRVDVTAFSGNVTLTVSGAPAGVTATVNPTTITNGTGSATLTLTTAPGIATGGFPLTITATNGATNATTTVNLGIIPTGWKDQDIGGPGQDGGASFSNGVFTVNGGGNDIWSTADKFNFVYQNFLGALAVTARVDSQQHTDPWAKSGVMIRETTNAGAKYVGVYVTPSNGVSMQFRAPNAASAVDLARATGISAPHWVRLVRSGNTFTGYRSGDGTNWTQLAAASLTMNTDVLAGLAVTAHNDSLLNTSTFSGVSVPPPQPRISAFSISGSDLMLSGSHGVPGWTCWVLTSTNLALPLANWTRTATNVFGAGGDFTFTNNVDGSSARFYCLGLAP